MGVGNKDKSSRELDKMSADYLKSLRNNANATPFETGEVIAAGTRALQIAGGNTKEAMGMVKLAEDMAAEEKARIVYEHLIDIADDEDVIDVLLYLRQREVVHYNMFKTLYKKYKEMKK